MIVFEVSCKEGEYNQDLGFLSQTYRTYLYLSFDKAIIKAKDMSKRYKFKKKVIEYQENLFKVTSQNTGNFIIVKPVIVYV